MNPINFLAQKYYKVAYDTFFYIEDTQKALECVNLSLNYEPHNLKALKLKGKILLLKGEYKEALKIYETLNKTLEIEDFEVLSRLAFCYEQLNENEKALEFCQKSAQVVELNESEKMRVLYRLKIELLIKAKKFNNALKLFKNALKILNNSDAVELKSNFSFASFYKDTIVELKSKVYNHN